MCKYSIIIPAYNCGEYIKKTIEEILHFFDGKDFEIIIVDDGSFDNTWEVIRNISQKHSEVLVFHTENKGVGAARNLGLDNSHGEYILFFDADDEMVFFDRQLFFNMVDNNVYDLIVFSFIEKSKVINRKFILETRLIYPEEYGLFFKNNAYEFSGPWSKIYKRNIIDKFDLRYNINQPYGEDCIFVLNYMSKCEQILLSNVFFYNHIISNSGASSIYKYYDLFGEYIYKQFLAFVNICSDISILCDVAMSHINQIFRYYFLHLSQKQYILKFVPFLKKYSEYIDYSKFQLNDKKYAFRKEFFKKDYKKIAKKLYYTNIATKIKFKIKKIIRRLRHD